MFGRIDHIGVAVTDLDAAIELHRDAYGMDARRTARRCLAQGVEAVLLDVGENHVELLAPLSATTRRSASSWPSAVPACTTWPTRSTDIDAALGALRDGRRAADRRASRAPGIRSSRVAFLHPAASAGC